MHLALLKIKIVSKYVKVLINLKPFLTNTISLFLKCLLKLYLWQRKTLVLSKFFVKLAKHQKHLLKLTNLLLNGWLLAEEISTMLNAEHAETNFPIIEKFRN